ncbi:hypothetical protein BH23GEM9_BH23GEM9_13170 [soil metagenome]
MEQYRRRRIDAAAAVLLLALSTACGGGGGAEPPSAGTDPDRPPAVPPTPPPGTPPTLPPGGTPPLSALIDTPDKYFVPAEVTIAVGGTVTWRGSDNRHEILFEGASPPGGDIPLLREGMEATRIFPTAGTYRFACARHGDVGVVHVVAAGGPPPDVPQPPPPSGAGATVTTPGVSFSPAMVTIAAGEAVTWQFTGTRHNVVFRGATPPGGNIPDTDAGRSVSRTFTARGTYDYDCTRHSGMSGRVNVQ